MGSNVFDKEEIAYLRHTKISKLPKALAEDVKCCYQRITRGFSDKDLWNIDQWFLALMPDMLERFKETRHGSPSELDDEENGIDCHEKWDDILDQMISLFREAADSETLLAISDRADECKNEGLKMFSRYFWDLWD